MPGNVVGKMPEFTQEGSPEESGTEEVKEAPTEEEPEVGEEEKETPSELPAEEKPAEEPQAPGVDAKELLNNVKGLQEEREKLLEEIKELRGDRREIKQEALSQVETQLEELKDVNPEDVAIIEKILRSKGYLTKAESQRMYYDSVKQQELNSFLNKFPEYKPENDSNDINWNALQRELKFYRLPENPHDLVSVLLKAHNGISRATSDRSIQAKKRQVEVAGTGAGGTQRSSSRATLPSRYREIYERGGWSEEEISRIEKNLPEE